MGLSLKADHLKRYKDLLYLLARYGGRDLVRQAQLDESSLATPSDESGDASGKPEALARDLEELGPTFIKLGQLLSTRPDILPPSYLEALARLQDRVEPFAFAEVETIVSEEIGVRISKAFQSFDEEPIAAASLSQVHHARLRDGRAVAVKVQRPGIRERVVTDLDALDEVAAFLDKHHDTGRRLGLRDMLAQFRKSLLQELDFRQEAHNLVQIGENLRGYDKLVVPEPVLDYTGGRVLTMDYIRGTKVTRLSPLARLDVDGEVLAEELSKAYLDQILVDGLFHADPHPGNVFITDDHRLALLDMGMVARIGPDVQEQLIKLLLAIVDGDGRQAADLSKSMGRVLEPFDEERFYREVTDLVLRCQHAKLGDIQVGRIVTEIAQISGATGVRPSPDLTMLGKTLLNLDEVARTLAPEFDPNELIRSHAASVLRKRMLKSLSPQQIFSSMLEMNELTQQLPGRVNSLLRRLSESELVLKVDAFDETHVLDHLHMIANRLAISIVLAALLIGAAMMMRVETDFTLLGYPGIAMILFLVAAACGLALVVSIFMKNAGRERRKRR